MAQHLTVMTRKGQITIPVDIRRALDLKEGDKVEVTLENGHARLSPYGSVVARTAGALRGPEPAGSAEEERAAFERGVAEEVVASMGE